MISLSVSLMNHALRHFPLLPPCLWTKLAFSLDVNDDGETVDEEEFQAEAACTAKLSEPWQTCEIHKS